MSYANTRQEIHLVKAGDGTSTSTTGRIACVTRPFYVRRAAMMVVVAGTTTATVVTIKKRITPATDTGGTTIGTMTFPSATSVAGVAVYLDDLNTLISFGDEVVAVVTTASGGSQTLDIFVEVEDSPNNPDNGAAAGTLTQVTA